MPFRNKKLNGQRGFLPFRVANNVAKFVNNGSNQFINKSQYDKTKEIKINTNVKKLQQKYDLQKEMI